MTICKQVARWIAYSTEVQQRPLTTTSPYRRQHPALAAAITFGTALPLVRDEEAIGA
jgi:hypothetical protein